MAGFGTVPVAVLPGSVVPGSVVLGSVLPGVYGVLIVVRGLNSVLPVPPASEPLPAPSPPAFFHPVHEVTLARLR